MSEKENARAQRNSTPPVLDIETQTAIRVLASLLENPDKITEVANYVWRRTCKRRQKRYGKSINEILYEAGHLIHSQEIFDNQPEPYYRDCIDERRRN